MEFVSIFGKSGFRVTRALHVQAAAALILSISSFSQSKPQNVGRGYVIEGRVTDWVTGSGIEAATIAVVDSQNHDQSTLSMRDGSYQLKGSSRATVLTITCSQLGYSPNPSKAQVEITGGKAKWDAHLFKENGGDAYYRAAATKLSTSKGTDRITEAEFLANAADPISKKMISDEFEKMQPAGEAPSAIVAVLNKDMDARARAGIHEAQSSANQADQTDASNTKNEPEQSASAASQANSEIGELNSTVTNLDEYHRVGASKIRFHTGEVKLSDEGKRTLDQLAEEVRGSKGYVIEVTGYSKDLDQTGNAESQRMTNAVTSYLVENGVPAYRIYQNTGAGESMGNAEPEGRQARGDVVIVDLMREDISSH